MPCDKAYLPTFMKPTKKTSNKKPVRQVFSQFCLSHGVPKQANTASFEKRLKIKFREHAQQYLDYLNACAIGDADSKTPPYSLIYSSLEFSNALSGQLDAERLGLFTEWVLGQTGDLSGKTIVDIGCGNGLLACFLAQQFPDAQVFAVDINLDATLVTDARAIGLRLENVHTFTGTLASFLKDVPIKADLIVASEVYANAVGTDTFVTGKITPDERDTPQQPLEEITLVSGMLTDDGLFFSQDSWPYAESLCRWVRICEASGLQFLAYRSKGLTHTDGNGNTQTHPVAVFQKNAASTHQARREDIISAYGRDSLAMTHIEDNEALADMIFSAWDTTDLYVGKAIFDRLFNLTFISRVGVAGGIGYYYTCTDAGMQSLHYGPSVRLRELLERVKADRKRYAGDGAAISWNTNHPETCASLGLDFEDNA